MAERQTWEFEIINPHACDLHIDVRFYLVQMIVSDRVWTSVKCRSPVIPSRGSPGPLRSVCTP